MSPQIWLGTWLEIILAKDFWTILTCLELKYNEFERFGASALGFCQTEKWVSMKITMQPGGGTGAASLGQTWVAFRPNAGTKSTPCTSRGRHTLVSLSPVSQRLIQTLKSDA